MNWKQHITTTAFVVLGATIAIALNQLVLEPLLIPDPCYYHSRDTSFLFDVFYDRPSYANGHPLPSITNLLTTLLAGCCLGWWIATLFVTRRLAASKERGIKTENK